LPVGWSSSRLPWRGRGRLLRRGGAVAGEGAPTIAAVIALSVIAVSADQPLTYLVFPGFIWAALRFGPQGATLAVAVAVLIAA
jgi:integral membrane sensor domain MASE1